VCYQHKLGGDADIPCSQRRNKHALDVHLGDARLIDFHAWLFLVVNLDGDSLQKGFATICELLFGYH
jgi:hypothetical protein